ncbi:unnamed protein product [Phytophthora fragariaefolia]|uniref:Unnamed protein product n=1 Tax=Phytophthora fragariaefolia TaxID=1490495 RepID=A0A9W6WSZ8_9STRA|nr:unnamed protein product [Phytophthora fragariaefolia]
MEPEAVAITCHASAVCVLVCAQSNRCLTSLSAKRRLSSSAIMSLDHLKRFDNLAFFGVGLRNANTGSSSCVLGLPVLPSMLKSKSAK